MILPWVSEEMRTADLHDKRLNSRLCAVLSQLTARPAASIPEACGGHAEMTAAYRFFDNKKAVFDAVLAPHATATKTRVAAQRVAILVQDTTEIDLTRPQQLVVGAGRLDGASRRGALLHLLHAFTPDGTPLGTVFAARWTRSEEMTCASRTRGHTARIPVEEKESHRWVTTLAVAQETARECSRTQCVCVADSESDVYEVLEAATNNPGSLAWIVRSCHNRALCPTEPSAAKCLRDRVSGGPELFRHAIQLRERKAKTPCEDRARRQSRKSRSAEVSIRATSVTLRPPWRPDRKPAAVTVNAVLVREETPPPHEEAVEWLLLTNLPIADVEQVRCVIQYYCVRWMIEVFFRVLKSGCRVQERRFETLDRILACLAVYLIAAWRTLYVCRLGRGCPELSCEAIFEPAEWKAAWRIARREDPPTKPPSLGEMVRLVARLGGYVERKCSPPGPQTLWLGLQRVRDFALCWENFGPDARGPCRLV